MSESSPLNLGAAVIAQCVRNLPDSPGVYRMLDESGAALYVGKAKALKRRVASYTRPARLPLRLQRMIARTRSMEFVYTHTEVEALLLEANLIKKLKPPYNVLLRDDKSFPYIRLTISHDFPRLTRHRGTQGRDAEFYGPFASAGAVNRTLIALQKIFMLRNCTDSYFAARDRPCLQYHIKRCTAPCVGYVGRDAYAGQVDEARAFLSGRSHDVQARFSKAMTEASERLDYEAAARYRDRIRAMTAIQARQDVNVEGIGDADVFALVRDARAEGEGRGAVCVQVFFFRGGQNYGNHSLFPRHDPEEPDARILASVMVQFYAGKPVPPEIITNVMPEENELIASALGAKTGKNRPVRLSCPARGKRARLTAFVEKNARDALTRRLAERAGEAAAAARLAEILGMESVPERIEVYDNSHISGDNMVGAMIVAGPEGFRRNAYRSFNIREAAACDDYGMMREVFGRRFAGLKDRRPEDEASELPDLVLVDGGKGQLGAALEQIREMGLEEMFTLAAVSKGPDRHAGREKIHLPGKPEIALAHDDPALHYIQRLRDEAHRFAIGAHRGRRKKALSRSALDDVPGIGPGRKKALLHHFGSARAVKSAGIADLEAVPGISRAVAERIYSFFQGGTES